MQTPTRGRMQTSCALCLLVLAGFAPTASRAQDSTPQEELPDSPGAVMTQRVVVARLSQGQTSAPQPSQPPQSQSSPQTSQSQSQSSMTQKPVGTAAAETPATTGVAASNPAGAAIAPPKQRRVRVLLIKVGALVGAGAALGTVAALSSASPSRPPGSH
jgi:hypothetical protein